MVCVQAEAALDTLNKKDLGEAKSLKKPPAGVDDVTAVVIILLEGNPKDKSWAAAQKLMNNVDKFLERLKTFKSASPCPVQSLPAHHWHVERTTMLGHLPSNEGHVCTAVLQLCQKLAHGHRWSLYPLGLWSRRIPGGVKVLFGYG